MRQTDQVTAINGIGEKTSALYNKLNIFTVHDLLNHYPRDYEEWKDIVNIGELRVNQVHSINALVISAPQNISIRKNLTITTIRVKDSSGACDIVYFNMPYIKNSFAVGKRYILRGQVVLRNNRIAMEQPKIVSPHDFERNLHTLTPIYPTTKGLSSNAITKSMRAAINALLWENDYLCDEIRKKYKYYWNR